MLKITLVVQDKKDGNCTAKLEMPKNLDKATENEKSVGGAIYQVVSEALKNMQKEQTKMHKIHKI